MYSKIRSIFSKAAPEKAPEAVVSVPSYPPVLVRMKDGRLAVIHHYKTDGSFGVRPITNEGRVFPNANTAWTQAQRESIPEEHSVKLEDLKALSPDEIPQVFR